MAAAQQLSLDGLIAFLACLFPYLPDEEALAYLDTDPMAAATLIITRCGLKSSHYSPNFKNVAATNMEMALRCAAVAAKHPDPTLLVKGWTNLSPWLIELGRRLSLSGGDADDFVRRLGPRMSITTSPDQYVLLNNY